MTDTHHPLPATGGSYLRQPDGALTQAEDADATTESVGEAVEPASKAPAKRAAATPQKEG
jgi:hypothetical protein